MFYTILGVLKRLFKISFHKNMILVYYKVILSFFIIFYFMDINIIFKELLDSLRKPGQSIKCLWRNYVSWKIGQSLELWDILIFTDHILFDLAQYI